MKTSRYKLLNNLVWSWLNRIKEQVVNFDVKPAKPIIPDLLQKVDLAVAENNYIRADKILHKLLAINNTNLQTLEKAIDVNLALGKRHTAIRLLKHAVKHYPETYKFHDQLAHLFARQGNLHASAKNYKQALKLRPESTHINHLLDACAYNNTALAPRGYIIDLFDSFAEQYEDLLVDKLAYRAHIELAAYISHLTKMPIMAKALDLGCGTGLLGQELLRHFAIQHLMGVDLSAKMLERCQAKNTYHTLHNTDLIDCLHELTPGIDLVVSADALVYLGDLTAVFEHCYRILQPGGYLGFSVEMLRWGDFKLTTTGRYQHSLRYIRSLYKRYQFSKMYSQAIDLRLEYGNMVAGYLVLLQK